MAENLIEKAIMFATLAHSGQVRKGRPSEPEIVHPLAVGEILRSYGADENVTVAGYLHDVPEETNYSIENIRTLFGDDIAHLVDIACEIDKSKSWEERKKSKIAKMKAVTFREKLVPLADRIANIEDLGRLFKEKGCIDFSDFKRGKEKQEWYNRSMYEAIAQNTNKDDVLIKRLEHGINSVFGRTMEEYKESKENTER